MLRWPESYEELANAMLALRSRFPDAVLHAASIVHPRHSIPAEHVQIMAELEEGKPASIPSWYLILGKWIVCLTSAAYDSFWLAVMAVTLDRGRKKSAAAEVVIKSWTPGREHLSKEDDFYYGSFQKLLSQNNARSIFIVGDAKSNDGSFGAKLLAGMESWRFAAACLKNGKLGRYPEVLLIPWWAPLSAMMMQLKCAVRLRRFSSKTEEASLRSLSARATLDVLRPFTTKNSMYYWIAKYAVQLWKPRCVVTLFEGQPWEKNFWKGAKAADPFVKLAGYQHTVLLPHCLALLKPQQVTGEIASPDIVLCTGEGTRQRLQEGFRPFQSQLLVLGSHRRPVASVNPPAPRPSKKTVLVLPEGILKEMILLFDLAMELAARLPDHAFVFRCHPVLTYQKAAPFLKQKLENFQNIRLSNHSAIHDDFVECSALLYRGSSAAIYSVLDGVKPIYWAGEPGPVVDPLYLVAKWKEQAVARGEFERILNSFRGSDGGALLPDWTAACREVDAMIEPMTVESVGKFVAALEPCFRRRIC